MPAIRILGQGRAGRSFASALGEAGWRVEAPLGRGHEAAGAARGVDAVLIATPDDAIAAVARAIEPYAETVVLHVSGSLGLDVLEPHPRRGSLHPLASLPNPEVGARRLLGRCHFAVSGDPLAERIASDLGGEAFQVPDARRAAYHAAGCIACNHLVALFGQVERLAARLEIPLEAFLALARDTLDNVGALGARDALTGPAARGDVGTLRRHIESLPADERALYVALARAAERLAGREGAVEQAAATAGR